MIQETDISIIICANFNIVTNIVNQIETSLVLYSSIFYIEAASQIGSTDQSVL